MATAIGNIGCSSMNRLYVTVIGKGALNFGIGAPLADAAVIDTGKVRLAGQPGAKADVQGVIPDVQLPYVRSVPCRDEVDGIGVGDIDDVLIGADAVEAWDFVVG